MKKKVNDILVYITPVIALLLYLIKPDYGATICGGSTVLFQFTDFYIVTAETMWYFAVRFLKMFGSFLAALIAI